MLDVSIVLYNSARWLPALVDSLRRQSVPLKDVTLLVQDNGSTDDSPDVFERLIAPHRALFGGVVILRGVANLGFGKGHNAAVAAGRAPFVCILNPDAELHEDCLAVLLETARGDAQAGAWEMRQAPYEHPKVYDPVTLETRWVSGAGVMFRRAAFEEIGGFDPRIFLYGEDVDISWRLREHGYALRYCPRAVLFHHTYSEPGEAKPAQFAGSTRANLYLRTRFGTWRDIAVGLVRQASLLRVPARYVPWRAAMVLKGLLVWLGTFWHWRSGARRTLHHDFRGWDYDWTRLGAFHDVCAGIRLTQQPRVSVLIRTIGRKTLLRSALATVVNQTYANVEVVIVEDGPPTLAEFLEAYKGKLDIVYHAFGRNVGRCDAGNKAMALATGEYFVFLDEDDLFYADHLEQLVAGALESRAKVTYSFAFELPSTYAEGGDGITAEGELHSRYRSGFSFVELLIRNYIPINTVLFHRSLYETCGGLDPAITLNEDWNLWVRYAIAHRPFHVVPKTTCIYRVPMAFDQWAGRRNELGVQQDHVRRLQAEMPVVTTVSEIFTMVEEACAEGRAETRPIDTLRTWQNGGRSGPAVSTTGRPAPACKTH